MTVLESRFSAELGQGGEQCERRRERQQREREQEGDEVRDVARRRATATRSGSRRRNAGAARSGERRRGLQRAPWPRPSRRSRLLPSVRDGGRRTRRRAPRRRAHVLLRRDRCGREEREGPQSALVEVPPREQEQGARERDRVEVAHGQPLHGRREEVGHGERRRGPGARPGACVRARRPAALRLRRRPPGRRAATRGLARATRAARAARGSGRSGRRAARSARRARQ